jgi:hypothetical protein
MELERQHFSHASINLIEYLRYNLSFVAAHQGLPGADTHLSAYSNSKCAPRVDPDNTSTQRP